MERLTANAIDYLSFYCVCQLPDEDNLLVIILNIDVRLDINPITDYRSGF